jgi:hypothetical protein
VPFEAIAGSRQYFFDTLVGRACRHADLFVDLEEIERWPHVILRVPGSVPHR